jgi:O-antigen/teichoic acid export membrane protein
MNRVFPVGFLRNVLVLVAGEGGVMALNLVTGILLARGLGPEGRGAYLAVAFWPQILGWCATLGFPKASAYFRAKALKRAGSLFTNALAIVLIVGGVVVGGGLLALPHLLHRYPPGVVRIGQAMLFCLFAIALSDICQGLLQGAARFGPMTAARLTLPVVQCVGFGALFLAGRLEVGTAAIVLVAGTLGVLLLQLVMLGSEDLIGAPDRGLLVETGRYAIRSYPAFLASVGLLSLDQIVLIPLLSPAELGLYVVATRALLLAQAPSAAAQVLFSHIPALSAGEGRALTRRTIAAAAVLTGAVGLGLAVLAPRLISILFGPAFLPATSAFRVLLLGAIAMGLARITAESLSGLGRPLLTSVTQVATLGAMALGLWVFVPRWGIVGAGWAVTMAHCVGLALASTLLWREATA